MVDKGREPLDPLKNVKIGRGSGVRRDAKFIAEIKFRRFESLLGILVGPRMYDCTFPVRRHGDTIYCIQNNKIKKYTMNFSGQLSGVPYTEAIF